MQNLTPSQKQLLNAILNREFVTVNNLLAQGVSPDFKNSHGVTPFMALAAQEWSEMTMLQSAGGASTGGNSDVALLEMNIRQKYEAAATKMMSHIPLSRRKEYVNARTKLSAEPTAVAETAVDISGYDSGVGKIARQYGGMTGRALDAKAQANAERLAERSSLKEEPKPKAQASTQPEKTKEPTDHPNFWQRYAPRWLGGWSREEVENYDNAMKKAGKPRKPNFWDRYAPRWLGGWSGERLEAYDKEQRGGRTQQDISFWDRHLPSQLGGMTSQEVAAHDAKMADAVEVFKGVTVGKLKGAGYSQEQIQKMQNMIKNKIKAHQSSQEGMTGRLGQNAEPVKLTMADYQSIGLDRKDAIQIAALAKNKENRE